MRVRETPPRSGPLVTGTGTGTGTSGRHELAGVALGMATPFGLARRSVGAGTLALFGISASAPMTVLAGGILTTYAATGVIAVPLSFPLLAVALSLFSVGFAAMSRDVAHAASFTALLSHGLGSAAGAVGSAVALLSYNAIQFALYGLFGATAAAQTSGVPWFGSLPWWVWAALAWIVVTAMGVFHIHLSARVIGAILAVELTVIVLFTAVGLVDPADPPPGTSTLAMVTAPLRVDLLVTSGLGGVLALGIAAFVGFETVCAFREEVRDPRILRPALQGVVGFLGVFYALAAWALATAAGSDRIVDAARDPVTGPDLVFTLMADRLGPVVATLGRLLLVLSIIGSMVAFHNVVARYLFTLGREHALPSRLGRTGGAGIGGVPTAASVTQSSLAAVIIAAFALSAADPLAGMFLWLATLAAIGVLTLMVATCIAVVAYYHRPGSLGRAQQPRPEHQRPDLWTRLVAPALAAVALGVILAVTVANLDSTVAPNAAWLLPVLVVAAAALGLVWAAYLRARRPMSWTALGRSRPAPLAVLDGALADLEL